MTDITQESYYQDWKTVLIPNIQQTEAWADLFDGLSVVFAENIYKYVEKLRYIRDPSVQDKLVNIQQAQFLGFKYKSDLFTEEEYANLVYFLSYFNKKVKGTESFVNFIGWVKNAKFKIHQLWAKGKYQYSDTRARDPFEWETQYVKNNSFIDDTGTKEWYPTSHVDLEYDAELFKIDESDLWYLFYKCAPIHLVLRSVGAVFTAETYQWNFNLGRNDYTNTHICLPCIYRQIVKFFGLTGSGYSSILYNSQKAMYGYKQGVRVSYTDFYCFDKSYTAKSLPSNFSFSRDSIATNMERGDYLLETVDINYPRFEYYPESPQHILEGKGLLLEESRTNLLLDSSAPINRQLYLTTGTYTFSGVGTYSIKNLTTGNYIFENLTDGEYTFSVVGDTQLQVYVIHSDLFSRFQLELGSWKSSYIPTSSKNILTREAESLVIPNLITVDNKCMFHINFDIPEYSTTCTVLKVYESQANFIEIKKMYNNFVISVQRGSDNLYYNTSNYTGYIILSISKEKIYFNGTTFNFPLLNCPIPKYCSIGQDYGKNIINGYITKFFYIPNYLEPDIQ